MGYLHIDNLYKNQSILAFRRCYALEKIHGTSAHVQWSKGRVSLYSGGEKYERFAALFDTDALAAKFAEVFGADVTVRIHGECYGGKMQAMASTYGPDTRFVVFDVLVGDKWLDVPKAEAVAKRFGLEFIYYAEVPTDLEAIDAERDAESVQAVRNGMGFGHKREGVVLRPLTEVTLNNGERVIAKHKRDDFRETKAPRRVAEKLEVLAAAQAIADEWVTAMRLEHVADKMPDATGIEHTGAIISAMVEDIRREGEGEIEWSKAAEKAISAATAKAWKARVKARAFA
jgi:hypothetical protein